ncbi:MAG: hypothetical protein SGJ02_10130 [bacterium]|nr:hypothetical protein [bacterium]
MIGKPGPFQIVEGDNSGCLDAPMTPPRRRYLCQNYTKCLDVAGALNWDNFTCRGCSGETDQTLLWRAKNSLRKEHEMQKVFHLPEIEALTTDTDKIEPLKVAGHSGKR